MNQILFRNFQLLEPVNGELVGGHELLVEDDRVRELSATAIKSRDATVIDCLTDQPWHDNWNLARVPYRLARIHPRGLIPLLFGTLPASLRPLAKRLLGRG